MNQIFSKIKEVRNNFDNNLDNTKYNTFQATKEILNNFKEIFNPKNIFIIALFASGSANAFDSPNVIDKVFNDSIKIQSIHYNEKLPTYFENKNNIEDNKKDIILQNEFWKGNVTTLVFDNVDKDILDNAQAESMDSINSINEINQPVYANRYDMDTLNQDKVNDFFNGEDKYHHLIKNSGSQVDYIKETIDKKYEYLAEDFITYHEMAHSAYEQNASKYINFLHIDLNISDTIRFETHSDIASLLLVSKKHNLNFEEFKDFSLEIAKFRGDSTKKVGDFIHNSSTAIIDLIDNLESNQYIYNTMDKEKISAFSAYYVDQLYKTPSKVLNGKLNNAGIETDIESLIKNIANITKSIQNDGDIANLNGKDSFYLGFMQDIYYKKNPDKFKELSDSLQEKDMFKSKYLSLILATNLSFKDLTESEQMIYAVHLNKKFKEINYSEYSNSITQVVGKEIGKYYKSSVLSDHFNNSKKELKEVIKYN